MKRAVFLTLSLALSVQCSGTGGQLDKIVSQLQAHGFGGTVYPYGTDGYAKYRPVEIAECNVLYPLVIVRPRDERDVAVAIKTARHVGIQVSVRSGGHGYNCNSIKNGSLHFDMRRINHVQLFQDHYTKVI